MIHVDRGAEPAHLAKNKDRFKIDLLAALAQQRLATTDLEKKAAAKQVKRCQAEYSDPAGTVKGSLKASFHGKCAYCEAKITVVAYPHIEHFEPKDKAPEKTFEWTNLLLACPICNGAEWKGTKFPTAAEGGPFLDPCGTDVIEDHLFFQYDAGAAFASIGWKTVRGKTTIDELGLNSDKRKELVRQRSERFLEILTIFKLAAIDPGAAVLWKAAVSAANEGSREYAAFVRALDSGELVFL